MERSGRGRDEPARDRRGRGGGLSGTEPGRGQLPPRGRLTPPPIVPDPHRYTMAELEEHTGFGARTIRYYVSQGLLPPAHGRGPAATYDLGHLLRLRMIQLLKAAHLPLEEIKERLHQLSDEEIAAMLEVQTHPPEDRWRRVQLHPDIELHVRDRGGKDQTLDDAAEIIIGLARPVIDRLEEGR